MPENESPQNMRRSSRISVTIPLEVRSQNPNGGEARVAATTKYVNRHGALLLTEHMFPTDSEVTLYIPHLERQAQCRVVWVSEQRDKSGLYCLGIELKDAENFWGVQFPPDDWIPSPQAPLAGEQPSAVVSPTDADEQERRTLRIMVNAMVAVLEEKGLLTRGELAESFQRLSRADASARAQAEERAKAARSTTL
jgi:hypothetical protein